MSGTDPVENEPPAIGPAEQARKGVEQAEAGNQAGADQLEQARNSDPTGVEAVEQEAADGPEGQGLSR